MGDTLMIAVMVIVMIVASIFLISLLKKDDSKGTSSKKNDKKTGTEGNKKEKTEDVFKFMEFDQIIDNMIIQNGGNRYTMAIKCKGINYDLMSEAEQSAVEQGFITFLNTLKYPIQLYVQAQNIDLKDAVNDYKRYVSKLEDEYNEINERFKEKSKLFDVKTAELNEIIADRTRVQNVYEYAYDIISYVEKMSVNKNLLQRNFYVIVSYSKNEIAGIDKFSKNEVLDMCYTELTTRCKSIISGLASCSVTGETLDSNQLADLLYGAYNRDDKSVLSVKEAIESDFTRLYSVSEDVFKIRDAELRDSIDVESRIRAINGLEKALEKNTYKTESSQELEKEEAITRNAVELIKNEANIEQDIKDVALDSILDEYRENKKDLLIEDEKEKEEVKSNIQKEKEELEKKYESSHLYEVNKMIEDAENTYNENVEKEKKEIREKLGMTQTDESQENDSII